MTLGQRVQQFREDRGWSIYHLERATMIPWTYLMQIEKGEITKLADVHIKKIARAFGMTAEELEGEG